LEGYFKILSIEEWNGIQNRFQLMEHAIENLTKRLNELDIKTQHQAPEYLTVQQSAELLEVKENSVHVRMRHFKVRRKKQGANKLVHVEDLKNAYSQPLPVKPKSLPKKCRI
jgi:uncharacterized protein (DUF342 family)